MLTKILLFLMIVSGVSSSTYHKGHTKNSLENNLKQVDLYKYRAKITEVYDGDTVTADIDLGFRIWIRGEKLRLHGIDAPEVRGATRENGLKSRDYLRKMVLNKTLIIETIKDKKGKWGRYLAIIWLDGKRVNEIMIENGFAIKYE